MIVEVAHAELAEADDDIPGLEARTRRRIEHPVSSSDPVGAGPVPSAQAAAASQSAVHRRLGLREMPDPPVLCRSPARASVLPFPSVMPPPRPPAEETSV